MSKGSIRPHRGSVCPCGGTFKSTLNPIVNSKIPICTSCGAVPKRFKVRKTIPSLKGESVKKDFYYALDGRYLETVADCIGLIEHLHNELSEGTFKPERYSPKSEDSLLVFKILANTYLKEAKKRSEFNPNHDRYLTPASFRNKLWIVEKFLIPKLGSVDITKLSRFKILEFYNSFEKNLRTRELVLGELKTMLRFAWNDLGVIETVPAFPKLKRARKRKASEVIDIKDQASIINNIKNEMYRDIFIICAVYALRPCEVRAIKLKDLDFKNKTLTISRHVSKGGKGVGVKIIPGRKSIKKSEDFGVLTHHITSDLESIFLKYTKSKLKDDFLFPGKRGAVISHDALREAWMKSCKDLGIESKMYTGVRHATLSALQGEVKDLVKLSSFSGHTNTQILERYAKNRGNIDENLVISDRFKIEKSTPQEAH